jgi:hypothetical protein
LWSYLSNYETKTGGEALAIPHNSNITYGHMFSLNDFDGRPITEGYAAQRSLWEPLVEATQIKGDSETHPVLSPEDEFSDYETWNGMLGKESTEVLSDERLQQKPYEYVRSGLKLGLQQQAQLGINPFKFGLIGSTDAHTSLPAVAENNFWGKFSIHEPSAQRMTIPTLPWAKDSLGWQYHAAG